MPEVQAQLELLRAAASSSASTRDPDQAKVAAILWLRGAVGADHTTVRLYLPDRSGALRLAASEGERSAEGRLRSARRRAVFLNGQAVRVPLGHPPGRELAILPLVSRGESLGVVEVVAPTRDVDRRWDTLSAVVHQISVVFRALRERQDASRAPDTLGDATDLAGRLLRATSEWSAVGSAAAFVHERFGIPVAGWVKNGRPESLELAVVKGMGSRKRARLRSQMGEIPRTAIAREDERSRLAASFGGAIGTEDVLAVVVGDALLMTGDAPSEARACLPRLASLVRDVLKHLAKVDHAEQQSRQLDAGIAWTAHEFRGPVLGMKAALECVLELGESQQMDRGLLRRSHQELEVLARDVDALLRWASDADSFPAGVVDLAELVSEAIESTVIVHGEGQVTLDVRRHALVKASSVHLRRAIANVLTNALQHSPVDAGVEVVLGRVDGFATVSITDHGPGIPVEERQAIFSPFVRGTAAVIGAGGYGLGLFVTKRVIESCGGWIRVESTERGTTFRIGLPLASERSRRPVRWGPVVPKGTSGTPELRRVP